MATKTWFSARLLFASDIDGVLHSDRLCEESVIVVQAADEEQGREAAQHVAAKMEHAYLNDQGENVQWRFLRVLEMQDLCEENITSGTEVFSRMFYESQTHDPDVLESLAPVSAIQR